MFTTPPDFPIFRLPHLPTPPFASLMKRTSNLNGLLCTFETIFYDSHICLVIWKQVSGFIVCFCLLQTDCLTFRLTSAQTSPGELGLAKLNGTFWISFESLLKSVRTFNVWSKTFTVVAIARNWATQWPWSRLCHDFDDQSFHLSLCQTWRV